MSHHSHTYQKPIISYLPHHSRDSSVDSRTSSSSRSSTEYNSSTSSRTSMAKGYYDLPANDRVQYRRVPDSESKYMTTTTSTSKSGRTVQVNDHQKAYYHPDESRGSYKTYEEYSSRSQDGKNRYIVYTK